MLPGDILLVSGEGKLSSSLVTVQKVIYPHASSSHVELSLGDGVFIHSTGNKGVHLTLLIDEDIACKSRWRVIRHRSITDMCLATENLQKAAMFFYAQDYNKAFMGSGNESSSFCSELVAKAYARAEIEIIGGKAPSKVTPAHFDKEADNLEDWVDVTEEYQAILADMKKNLFPYRLAANTLSAVMTRRKAHEPYRQQIIERLEGGSVESQELARTMREMLSGRELKYWHEKDR
ncbi:Permuted papain-like amidase enzyme, YaeF/YiiX, C92 family [Marinomonas polaris DSM 16579]|uniref:Permuted papain-like amidase enzyme, YaeF/YiiX, C92 family n=1 Tax=Marinomonas polaris DSM 16579 TaxID=1122206 RepID=A0A1M5D1G1_9GAMM|nr:YiiX/YebB-like N1pC/P60 family cysteine hydrolase [Marinomonas polaris]SHF60720.1 Permuted papain-like amidase enzyme, YaeF/YiiX, C92 family [Marinomonas polaris DSM 16579]